MLKIIENFCKNNELLFSITDNNCLKINTNNIEVPFVNYTLEQRINPLLTMGNCKSIIVVLMNYKINSFSQKNKPLIASPHQYYDYHNVLLKKLEELASLLNEKETIEYKIFADTGMLMERELAKKAGLGYFSKNTNLINEKFGSNFFIGYIMIDKEIEFSNIVLDKHCGNCEICVKSCPTKAINGDYTLNHNKCLSYITQKKEDVLEEEKPIFENKIYGCNVCTIVCPKNKHNIYYKEENFEFSDFLNLTNKEFKQKYKNTGFYWRGNSVIKRNTLIAFDNSMKEE